MAAVVLAGVPHHSYMRFTRAVYVIAAIYGLLVLTPMYFLRGRMGIDLPPAITHPEFYYGFIGVAIVWQAVLLIVAKDPLRFRPLMPVTIAEKFVYPVPVVLLYFRGQVQPVILWGSLVDPIFGILFLVAYFRSRP